MYTKRSHSLAFSRSYDVSKKKREVIKPQLNFTDKVNNNETIPFIPRIKLKPNAIYPLSDFFTCATIITQIQCGQILIYEVHKKYPELLQNSYYREIQAFKLTHEQIQLRTPQVPKSLDDTKYVYVDCKVELNKMMDHIKLQRELAIDLEAHQFRSYYGFTCLIQMSSRTNDYLVDALALRDELHVLNNVFTDPSIVK
ncbi:unnamed protein product, partial [Didymodactylos carnosus]